MTISDILKYSKYALYICTLLFKGFSSVSCFFLCFFLMFFFMFLNKSLKGSIYLIKIM